MGDSEGCEAGSEKDLALPAHEVAVIPPRYADLEANVELPAFQGNIEVHVKRQIIALEA
jgi:hypothetical protein